MEEILKIENLHVSFDSYAGEVHAVRGVSLEVQKKMKLMKINLLKNKKTII